MARNGDSFDMAEPLDNLITYLEERDQLTDGTYNHIQLVYEALHGSSATTILRESFHWDAGQLVWRRNTPREFEVVTRVLQTTKIIAYSEWEAKRNTEDALNDDPTIQQALVETVRVI